MNPILLKPNSDQGSQVVVNGKVWRNLSAREYYTHFPYLLEQVLQAYRKLASEYEFIVMEGAGSITELNLKQTDLVNLGLATRLQVPVLLVADIDRGGVFASVVGSFCLLEEHERSLVRSFVVNRFRGDPSLFEPGVEMLQARTGKPCLGVFPYLPNLPLDPEDGVALPDQYAPAGDVAIIALPHISNLSDFRLLPHAHRITRPVDRTFAAVILPGTKNTLSDLQWLRNIGLAEWIYQQHLKGARIIGICGGFQIMGETIGDPLGMESALGTVQGLGLFPCHTVLTAEKTTRPTTGFTPSGIPFEGYEIHLGVTTRPNGAVPFATLADGTKDGIRAGRCTGTYLHGALEDPAVLSELLGFPVAPAPTREAVYEAMADWFEANVHQKKFQELYLCG